MPKRALYAALAWGAATATAMAVVWAGLDSVLPTATEGPHVAAWPAQNVGSTAAPIAVPIATPSATPSATAGSGTAGSSASAVGRGSSPAATTSSPAAKSDPAPGQSSPTGAEQRYSTVGGTAVLTVGTSSATLDAAIPATGYSARYWTETGMLEVVFSPNDGGTVYEVIATWNGTSPQVRTYAVGG